MSLKILYYLSIYWLSLAIVACAKPLIGDETWNAQPITPTFSPSSDNLEWRGGIVLTSNNPNFGGLSSLNMSTDRRTVIAISDRGQKFTIKLRYDKQGWLIGADDVKAMGALINPKGKTMKYIDAEGQTKFRNGTLVSLERKHALWFYPPHTKRAQVLTRPQSMEKLPANKGVEAITTLKDGRLLLIAEGGEKDDDTLPAWLGVPGKWKALRYSFDGSFRPTDATVLPKGNVLILERNFFLTNFSWRLMLINQNSIIPNTILKPRELTTFSFSEVSENMEGLATRVNTEGEILIYVISDNNFLSVQQTMLLQFKLLN